MRGYVLEDERLLVQSAASGVYFMRICRCNALNLQLFLFTLILKISVLSSAYFHLKTADAVCGIFLRKRQIMAEQMNI